MAWLKYVKFFISFVEFVHFYDLSLIPSSSNMVKTATWKSQHRHLGIIIQI